jgi:hypothetical protein
MNITNMPNRHADHDFKFEKVSNSVATLHSNLKIDPKNRKNLTGAEILNFADEAYLVDYAGKRLVNVRGALSGSAPVPSVDVVRKVTVEFASGRKEVVGN